MMIAKFCLIAFVVSSYFFGTFALFNLEDSVKFRLYNRDFSYKEVVAQNAAVFVKSINKTACTQFYAHGFTESLDSAGTSSLVKALVKYTPCNVIGIDYRSVSQQLYPTAVLFSNAVAKIVASGIEKMVAAGLDKSKLIISGTSLGGQLSGDIVRDLPFSVPEVQGYDPAGPLFELLEPSLRGSDAVCVKCIHVNSGLYGTLHSCGHVDFYPNGGRRQPGCKIFQENSELAGCSHERAGEYVKEALQNPGSFLGVKCNSYNDFKAGKCDRSVIIPWGTGTPCNVTGKFFLQTNAKSPYGRGLAGTVYDPSIDENA